MAKIWGAALLAVVALLGCSDELPNAADLRAMAARGDVEGIRRAVRAGVKIDAADASGYTPLAIAAFNGRIEAVKTLFELGANPDVGFGYIRPLTLAASQGDSDMVRLLIDRGAKTVYDSDRDQPLSFATDPEVIAVLVSHGADVNLQSGATMETSLHRSSAIAHPESVRLLLSLGADPRLANASGFTALHLVCRIRNADLLPGGKRAVREVMRMLLKAGADPNAKDRFESTPLHHASRSALFGPEELGLLITSGAKIDIANAAGRTPKVVAQLNGLGDDEVRMKLLSGHSAVIRPK